MAAIPPRLDNRDFERFYASALELAKRYCPEWTAFWPADPETTARNDPGLVLLKLFSLLAAYLAEMENQVPEQRRLAFYQFMNLQTRPPVAARAPLSFSLRQDQPPRLIPAQSVVLALPDQKIRFQTDADLLVIPAEISAARSLQPGQDTGRDLMPMLRAGQPATLFSALVDGPQADPLPHWFLMGDGALFKPDPALQRVVIRLTGSRLEPAFFERWYDGALTSLAATLDRDPDGLALSVTLDAFPAAPPRDLAEVARDLYGPANGVDDPTAAPDDESLYWLLTRPALGMRVTASLSRQLPVITGLSCTFSGGGIPPEATANTLSPLDVANGAYPFGETPAAEDAFFIRSDSLFARTGARITLSFALRPVSVEYPVALDWQFHDGRGWRSFNATPADLGLHQFSDTTNALRGTPDGAPDVVSFLCPAMGPAAVGGAEGLWIRAVIASGGYGHLGTIETAGVTAAINAVPDAILTPVQKGSVSAYLNEVEGVNFSYTYIQGEYSPPYIKSLQLDYSFTAQPSRYWTYNTFALSLFGFRPYEPVTLPYAAFLFALAPSGLARYGLGAPLSLYVHVVEERSGPAAPMRWWFRDGEAWRRLEVDDATDGLTRSGLVAFTIPAAMAPSLLFSQTGFWFRVDALEPDHAVRVWSITPNSVMAGNRIGIDEEVVGSSDDRPNQSFVLAYPPILAGLALEVVEPRSLEPPGGDLAAERPLSAVTTPAEAGTAEDPLPVVRRWRQVDTFAFAGPSDRVFVLDSTKGIVTFGDGRNGMIPPAGHDNIVARHYDQTQGEAGNVPAATLTILRPGIADIDAVYNPAAAAGGVGGDTAATVARTGPGRVRAGGRAVQLADMSVLAEMASPQVCRARANTRPDGTIVVSVLARSGDPRPYAGPALLDEVRDAVRSRSLATLAGVISAAEPVYRPIDVVADVTAAAPADQRIGAQADLVRLLSAFLQPVTGGSAGEGWHFGASVTAAAIARALRTDARVLSRQHAHGRRQLRRQGDAGRGPDPDRRRPRRDPADGIGAMSFELPDLDTRSGSQLQAELIRRIPMFTALWTDFNDSDPGITLVQLLCWIAESLLYQTNAIPLATQRNFLRLVLGLASNSNKTDYSRAAGKQNDVAFLALRQVLAAIDAGAPLSADTLQAAVLTFTAAPYAALTLSDVETLALETNLAIDASQSGSAPRAKPLKVRRADASVVGGETVVRILSDVRWTYVRPPAGNPVDPDAAGVLRRVLLYQAPTAVTPGVAYAEAELLGAVCDHLAPRVLLGSRIRVVAARLTPIDIAASVSCPPHVAPAVVLRAVAQVLFAWLQPGPSWAYGTAPRVDVAQNLIEAVPGVDQVLSIALGFVPTVLLPAMAELGVTALLADLPAQPPALLYGGLPRLRCLDLRARSTGR